MEEEAFELGDSCSRRAWIWEHSRPLEILSLSPVKWRLIIVPTSRDNVNKMLSTVPGAQQAPSPLLEEDELAKDAPLPGKSMCDDMVACEGKWLERGECRECEHKAERQPGPGPQRAPCT